MTYCRYANALSGTEGFFDNQEALFSALSSLRLASHCAHLGGGDEEQVGREEEIGAVYRTAGQQLSNILAYLAEREKEKSDDSQPRVGMAQ